MKKLLLITILILTFCFLPKVVKAGVIFRPVFHTGLVGYWDFQEGAGDAANDKSGYDNDGTLENMATSSNGGWTDGKIGSALDFDGTDDYVEIISASELDGMNDLTLSGWFKPGDTMSYKYSIYKSYVYEISWGDGGTPCSGIGASIFDTVSSRTRICSEVDFSAGTWYHVTITTEGTDFKIYINGDLKNTTPFNDSLENNANNVGIGTYVAQPSTYAYTGIIDEVRIYNRALSAGEVERLYKLSQPTIAAPTRTGLVGYWPFEEGTGTKAGDHSLELV
jgi:hypothetical protein